MAWELKKVEDQREQLVELYEANVLTMVEICARFGISRKTGYKWLNRHRERGKEGLKDLSKAPHKPYRLYKEGQIEKAIALKGEHGCWGPKKILAKLEQKFPELLWPSETHLYDLFRNMGLIRRRKLRSRVPASHPLADVTKANHTWTADFKGWFFTGDGCKYEPLTVTDSHSRYVIRCVHLNVKDTDSVWAVLEGAFREYGLPNRFRTDNGSPFGSTGSGRLTRLGVKLIKAGIHPEWIDPGHPEQNGRHERFHLTLQQEIADPPELTLARQQKVMKEFIDEYNYERPHEGLEMKTPSACYCRSERIWDGILRDPEYDSSLGKVRKVRPKGAVRMNGGEVYINAALEGEYIFFKEAAGGEEVYYGPIFLGIVEKERLRKPVNKSEIKHCI